MGVESWEQEASCPQKPHFIMGKYLPAESMGPGQSVGPPVEASKPCRRHATHDGCLLADGSRAVETQNKQSLLELHMKVSQPLRGKDEH